MKLTLARHVWGVTQPYDVAFKTFKQQGYDIIEASLLYSLLPKDELVSLLKELELEWIPMIFTNGHSVADHLESFKTHLLEVKNSAPIFVNAHSGSDRFTRDEAICFYREAHLISQDLGINVAHETHRGRTFFNPWITRDVLEAVPELQLCCDYSHWVTVCERLIDTESDILTLCAERCLHIHARVGFEQGPQVPDPRAPEYRYALEAHERWWDMIWDAQARAGRTYSTMTPEFGPAPYMPQLPYTQQPVSSQDDICLWQMQRQRERFHQRLLKNNNMTHSENTNTYQTGA